MGVKHRPIFEELLLSLQNGDVIVVTKLDRFCRTAREGLVRINKLLKRGVEIEVFNFGMFNQSSEGMFFLNTLSAFAEFERSMMIERTTDGKAVAKRHPDYRDGRRPVYSPTQIAHALRLKEFCSYSEVTRLTGISKSTIIRAQRKWIIGK